MSNYPHTLDKEMLQGLMKVGSYYRKKPLTICAVVVNCPCTIDTLEGTMRAEPGDYIIRGVNWEFYPCKPDIFEKTYERVSSSDAAVTSEMSGQQS